MRRRFNFDDRQPQQGLALTGSAGETGQQLRKLLLHLAVEPRRISSDLIQTLIGINDPYISMRTGI